MASAEPSRAHTRQMQSFTRVVTAQDGAVLVNAFHRRVFRRPSNIGAANSWQHAAHESIVVIKQLSGVASVEHWSNCFPGKTTFHNRANTSFCRSCGYKLARSYAGKTVCFMKHSLSYKLHRCARGLFSRDRGETETDGPRPRRWQFKPRRDRDRGLQRSRRRRGRGVPTPRRDRADALLCLETASRSRRQDRGHIPHPYAHIIPRTDVVLKRSGEA